MRRAITTGLVTACSLISSISALQVTPGSSCASVCLDSNTGDALDPAASTTNTSDIACYDVDYYSTAVGVKFKDCLECLQTSKNASDTESDVSWFIYNLRYASAVCLYDYPTHRVNMTETCDLAAACQPLQGAIETGLNLEANSSEFAYCSVDDSVFYGTGINDCVSCLQSSPDSYVANFLIALQAGCQQQPASGALLGLSGQLFSGYPLNVTTAVANSMPTTTRRNQKQVLSTGSIIGIVIGAAALLIIAIILFYLYWRRQQKYDREDIAISDPSVFYGKGPGDGGSYMTSLTSGHSSQPAPIYTTDHKAPAPPPTYAPPGAQQDALEMSYMDSAEYYDRAGPLAAMRHQHQHQLHSMEARSANHVDVSALPTHPSYITRGSAGLGSRASRSSTPSVRSEPRYNNNRPDPHAAQAYMSSLEDARDAAPPVPVPMPVGPGRGVVSSRDTSSRNVQVELAGPPDLSDPAGPRQGGGRADPGHFYFHAPSLSRASPPDDGGTSRMSSLILPSVPRLKMPGKKPPRLTFTGASPPTISGPLAFPDSRFDQRADDRIVEQTINRADNLEVPIGSGKSYLYG